MARGLCAERHERFVRMAQRHPSEPSEHLNAEQTVRAVADEAALTQLALDEMPTDIQEFGTRHGIPTFSRVVWLNAFITGWRAAFRAGVLLSRKDTPND